MANEDLLCNLTVAARPFIVSGLMYKEVLQETLQGMDDELSWLRNKEDQAKKLVSVERLRQELKPQIALINQDKQEKNRFEAKSVIKEVKQDCHHPMPSRAAPKVLTSERPKVGVKTTAIVNHKQPSADSKQTLQEGCVKEVALTRITQQSRNQFMRSLLSKEKPAGDKKDKENQPLIKKTSVIIDSGNQGEILRRMTRVTDSVTSAAGQKCDEKGTKPMAKESVFKQRANKIEVNVVSANKMTSFLPKNKTRKEASGGKVSYHQRSICEKASELSYTRFSKATQNNKSRIKLPQNLHRSTTVERSVKGSSSVPAARIRTDQVPRAGEHNLDLHKSRTDWPGDTINRQCPNVDLNETVTVITEVFEIVDNHQPARLKELQVVKTKAAPGSEPAQLPDFSSSVIIPSQNSSSSSVVIFSQNPSSVIIPSQNSSSVIIPSQNSSSVIIPSQNSSSVIIPSQNPSSVIIPSQNSSSSMIIPSQNSSSVIIPSQNSSSSMIIPSQNSSPSSSVIIPSQNSSSVIIPSQNPSSVIIPSQNSSSSMIIPSQNSSSVIIPSQNSSSSMIIPSQNSSPSSSVIIPSQMSSSVIFQKKDSLTSSSMIIKSHSPILSSMTKPQDKLADTVCNTPDLLSVEGFSDGGCDKSTKTSSDQPLPHRKVNEAMKICVNQHKTVPENKTTDLISYTLTSQSNGGETSYSWRNQPPHMQQTLQKVAIMHSSKSVEKSDTETNMPVVRTKTDQSPRVSEHNIDLHKSRTERPGNTINRQCPNVDLNETVTVITEVFEIVDNHQPARLKELQVVKTKAAPGSEPAQLQDYSSSVIIPSQNYSSSSVVIPSQNPSSVIIPSQNSSSSVIIPSQNSSSSMIIPSQNSSPSSSVIIPSQISSSVICQKKDSLTSSSMIIKSHSPILSSMTKPQDKLADTVCNTPDLLSVEGFSDGGCDKSTKTSSDQPLPHRKVNEAIEICVNQHKTVPENKTTDLISYTLTSQSNGGETSYSWRNQPPHMQQTLQKVAIMHSSKSVEKSDTETNMPVVRTKTDQSPRVSEHNIDLHKSRTERPGNTINRQCPNVDLNETVTVITEVFEIVDNHQPARLKELQVVKTKAAPGSEPAQLQDYSSSVIIPSQNYSSSYIIKPTNKLVDKGCDNPDLLSDQGFSDGGCGERTTKTNLDKLLLHRKVNEATEMCINQQKTAPWNKTTDLISYTLTGYSINGNTSFSQKSQHPPLEHNFKEKETHVYEDCVQTSHELEEAVQNHKAEKFRLRQADNRRTHEQECQRIEKERQIALERAEREKSERQKKLERDRKIQEELEKLKAMERERLWKEQAKTQRQLLLETQQPTTVNDSSVPMKPVTAGGLLTCTETLIRDSSITSYEISPEKASPTWKYKGSYDGQDEDSDEYLDEEYGALQKKIPGWATGVALNTALIRQFSDPPDLEELFHTNNIETPDLTAVFPGTWRWRYKLRTSSASWDSPALPKH